MATPLSPRTASKEQERVTLLLEINRELLMEVMSLQASQADAKKEESEGTEEEKLEKTKKAAISNREYMEYVSLEHACIGWVLMIEQMYETATGKSSISSSNSRQIT